MTTFNEFQRELQKRGIDGPNAYMFTLIYERLIHVAKEVETQSEICLALANSMEGVVGLHEQTQRKMKELAKHNQAEGIEVKSEPYDN